MVKFTATANGIMLIGLGLEAENVRRMQAGDPVRVKLSDLGFVGVLGTVQFVIFTGKDNAAMREALRQFIGPQTVVHDEGEDDGSNR